METISHVVIGLLVVAAVAIAAILYVEDRYLPKEKAPGAAPEAETKDLSKAA